MCSFWFFIIANNIVINIHIEVFLHITRGFFFKNQFLEELLDQSNKYF